MMKQAIVLAAMTALASVAGATETEDLLRFGYCEDDIGTNFHYFANNGVTNYFPCRVVCVEKDYPYTPAETAQVARLVCIMPGDKLFFPEKLAKIPDGFRMVRSGPWMTRWDRELIMLGVTGMEPNGININLTAHYDPDTKTHDVYAIRRDESFKRKEYALNALKLHRDEYKRMTGHYKIHDVADGFIVEYRRLFVSVAVAWSETKKEFVCETYVADKWDGVRQEPTPEKERELYFNWAYNREMKRGGGRLDGEQLKKELNEKLDKGEVENYDDWLE